MLAGEDAAPQRLALAVPIDGLTFSESLEIASGAERLGCTSVWSYRGRRRRRLLAARLARRTNRADAARDQPCARVHPSAGAAGDELRGAPADLRRSVRARTRLIVADGRRQLDGARAHQAAHARPETVEALQRILSGEKTTYEGETLTVRDFRLALDPSPTPVMLGALGPNVRARRRDRRRRDYGLQRRRADTASARRHAQGGARGPAGTQPLCTSSRSCSSPSTRTAPS